VVLSRRIILLTIALLSSSCVTIVPLSAARMARENQRNINRLHLGQTLAEVQRVMGKGPERRSTRLRFDGLSIEEWSYLTDYVRRSDTTITFVGGKVEEIRVTPWEEKD
jgi:hypothetical protein